MVIWLDIIYGSFITSNIFLNASQTYWQEIRLLGQPKCKIIVHAEEHII